MNPTTDDRTMVASPIAALLKSRKAIAAIVGVLLNIVIAALPATIAPIVADMRGELMLAITSLILALIGGIAYEDKGKPAPGTTSSTVKLDAQTVSTPETPPTPASTADIDRAMNEALRDRPRR